MDVKLAVLADFASVTREGKLNILGIFDEVNPATLPAVLPIIYVVVMLEAGAAEVDSEKNIALVLVDADGVTKMRIEQSLTVPPPPRPGSRTEIHQINALVQMPFEQAGLYQFVILVNGEEKDTISLRVNEPIEASSA